MGDLNPEDKSIKRKNKKKRKLRTSNGEKEEEGGPSIKASRIHQGTETGEPNQESDEKETSEILQYGPPWRNLQLILSLQNKEFDLQRYLFMYM